MASDLERAVLQTAERLRVALLDKVDSNLSGDLLAVRSGTLKASIVSTLAMIDERVAVSVGSTGVPYAAILETGGRTPPHEIVPVKARALLLAGTGGMRFARRVHHPGATIAARSYLGRALAALQSDITGGLKAAVLAAVHLSGVDI